MKNVVGLVTMAARTLTDERMSRIEQLTIAIKNGTYHPDPERIASRMLESSSFIDGCDEVEGTHDDSDELDA